MLLNLVEYRRPAAENGDVQVALALLARHGVRTAPLAGGDALVGSGDRAIEAVVDLQGLGLDGLALATDPPALHIGALVTRTALVEWPQALGATTPEAAMPEAATRLIDLLAAAARRWGGNVQRNRATVGGALVTAGGIDALVAALLACEASLILHSLEGATTLPVARFLAERQQLLAEPALITGIHVPLTATACALETVARTPADAPIVLAVACAYADYTTVVLGGVAEMPVVAWSGSVTAATAVAAEIAAGVQPEGDFRGSAAYRRAMARVLSERVLLATRQGGR